MASFARKVPVQVDPEELDELERLREEKRRMAITLGGFSAFLASRGLLEDAWVFINNVHQMDDGQAD